MFLLGRTCALKNEFAAKLRSATGLLAHAQKASKLLEEILGPSASQVTAVWDLAEEGKGRTLVTLRITDWAGAATTEFAPTELDQQSSLRIRLYHLWGDLLQARSEKQLQELLATGGEGT